MITCFTMFNCTYCKEKKTIKLQVRSRRDGATLQVVIPLHEHKTYETEKFTDSSLNKIQSLVLPTK